ncbi:MAG: hypothetical protein QOI43_2982 [Gaiellales bacterium]|jgi:uncharacterized cupredoxin-like copper-binding protein|nr:hypothetical protein [Gaiellales bacterium]
MSRTLTPGTPPAADNGASTRGPGSPPPPTDQEQFDAAVQREGKIVLQVLGGLAILAALVMSTVALVLSGVKSDTTVVTTRAPVAAAPSSPPISLSIAGSSKRGPDGKMHDAFTKTNFAVKVGKPTRLRINNTDDVPHSISSVEAGVTIIVQPGVHTYTIVAKKAGRFLWVCNIVCDSGAAGWAMSHPGYMAGYITAS